MVLKLLYLNKTTVNVFLFQGVNLKTFGEGV